jgi:cytochrome c oxidase assembly protein subunit 15
VHPGAASRRFRAFAWATLLFTLAVVLWGAVVRATGSGAGCNDHWPECNGQVIPLNPSAKTLVEYTHRLTSGVDGLLVLGLLGWACAALPRRHPARRAALVATVFMVAEAALGAVLVKYRLVVDDDSLARAVVMCVHLLNTLGLVGAQAAVVWWAYGKPRLALRGQGPVGGVLLGGLLALLALGASGALAALGDTLFPAESLLSGVAQDFATDAHALLRLRVLHPVLALGTGLYLALAARWVAAVRPGADTRRWAGALQAVFALQVAGGLVNLVLLAPVWMQLVHLLLADAVWVAYLLLCASGLSAPALAPAPAPGDSLAGAGVSGAGAAVQPFSSPR